MARDIKGLPGRINHLLANGPVKRGALPAFIRSTGRADRPGLLGGAARQFDRARSRWSMLDWLLRKSATGRSGSIEWDTTSRQSTRGVDRNAPATPQSQPQNISATRMITGDSMNCRPRN